MNKTILMIMGGALIVAVLVAVLVQAKLGGGQKAQIDSSEILVAKRKLSTGDILTPEDIRWQSWPEASFFKGVIKKADQPDENQLDVYDAPLRRNIEAGEPVTRQALVADIKGGNNMLAAMISPGMRAVAIPVKPETMVGGFLTPGDRVDVLLSYAPQLPSDQMGINEQIIKRFASETILSNIKVLAVDQNSKDEAGAAKVGKTVTLEVDREGAETVALARRMGDLTLALRRIGENDKPEDKKNPLTTDATTSQVIKTLNQVKREFNPVKNSVRVYSGNSIVNVPLRDDDAQSSSGGP
jgi:pilus assembly protein CpaB